MRIFVFSLIAAAMSYGQAAIYTVANAASNIPLRVSAGVPPIFANSSLSQGSMFVITGSGLGPASLVVADSYPLQTTLAGTSVQIVVGQQTTNAILYYTESQQVAAILPSTTPLGFGRVVLSYNGHSASIPINIVQNNVAMYTVGETGSGDALATLADNSVVMPNNAPHPGDVVVFWADGLGPVSYDETVPAQGGDMTSVPLEVFIGDQPAKILYRGRSTCCASLDQVNVQIPENVDTGCVVSVIMRIGTLVSNATTIPIASSGRVCIPTNPAISQSDVTRLMTQKSVKVGIISLERSIPRTGVFSVDGLKGNFQKYSASPSLVLDEVADVPAPGSCTVTQEVELSLGIPLWNDPVQALPKSSLDAGSGVTVTGANGATTLTGGPGLYQPVQGIQFLNPGPYTAVTTGGSNVGGFQASVTVPPPFTWANSASGNSIDRSKGLTLTFSGADPAGYVTVTGVGQDTGGSTTFSCTGRGSDGSVTVPSFVLQGLPTFGTVTGFIQIEAVSAPVPFTVQGLDLGYIWASEFDAQGLGYVVFQ